MSSTGGGMNSAPSAGMPSGGGGGNGGAASSSSSGNGGASLIPYQPKVFCGFIALVGRLFYDDAGIVLLDFFAKEQRAFSEAELKEVLRWRENLLLQQLAKLEQQLLLERVIEAERGSRTVYLWRLHPHVCVAIEWRLKSLLEALQSEVDTATQQNTLVCPQCQVNVSLLDAACGPKALEDDHPLCSVCQSKLTTCNSEQARQLAEDRLARAHKSLDGLRTYLARVKNMEVPSFTSERYQPPAEPANEPCAQEAKPPNPQPSKDNTSSSAVGGVDGESSDVSRAIPWFMPAQTPGAGAGAVPMAMAAGAGSGPQATKSQAAVSFGRSGSRHSMASAALSASSALASASRAGAFESALGASSLHGAPSLSGTSFSGQPLTGQSLTGQSLTGQSLTGQSLTGTFGSMGLGSTPTGLVSGPLPGMGTPMGISPLGVGRTPLSLSLAPGGSGSQVSGSGLSGPGAFGAHKTTIKPKISLTATGPGLGASMRLQGSLLGAAPKPFSLPLKGARSE
ncbi:hypothetical protein GNI_055240 [Gregarina niphandrodes]|uniref:Transcription initiation factor IIE subunit alpha N-terminal domain-containing protein n=1 Tax=Gregarina niphandrodes TaxID=110365 RepID=A0A023B905_GRENI|nr:hypothetical protein GNI_055240 [Gregarina niphandrodes]EZG70561.1 hypothetical protein GNI_055240 [Gregarina niphandrodes]|eukprot:XP_011129918.1 hypothetical protein GNI_055240 [Gregarina niphandrodes]